MRSQRLYFLLVKLLLILTFSGFNFSVNAQFSEEAGFFPITNFTPEDYGNALPQNWDIVQDKRGVMYFANNECVLEYDGIRWKRYNVTNETAVQSLAIDQNDRIYVGAINEFGYLAPNSYGDLEYVSLLPNIENSLRFFNEIRNISISSEGIYFHSNSHIFFWNGKKMDFWLAGDKYFHTSFLINDQLIINVSGEGLHIIKENELVKLKNTEIFADKAIFSITPYEKDNYLVVTKSNGFYKAKFNDEMSEINVISLSKDIKEVLQDYLLYNAVKISDNAYSIGTWGSGLLIYQNGQIVQLITKKSGLGDEVINSQFLDKDNNLWLTLSDGITKIEIKSPLTNFTEELGVDGTIEAIARFNGNLYLATERGLLLLLDEWSNSKKIYEQNKFKKIEKFEGGLWDLMDYNVDGENYLLIASNEGIFQMDKNNNFKFIYRCYPWRMYHSKTNSKRVFIARSDGLTSLLRKNKQWTVEYEFPEIDEEVFSVYEDKAGDLWLGTAGMGVLKIEQVSKDDFKDIIVKRFDISNGLPENCDFYVTFYDNKILLGTDQGIFEQIEGMDSFAVSKRFPPELTDEDRIITRMKPDKYGKLWVTTFIESDRMIEAGYVLSDSSSSGYKWVDTPFNTISKGDLYSIHFDQDDIIWFGGSEGLYRYDPKVEKDYKKDFASLIRLNIIGEDSTIFFGSYFNENGYVSTIQPEVLKPTLKYKYNSLEFEFAAQNPEIEYPVLFSYFLEGYDKKWSDWSEEAKRYYTNLDEGEYTFKVKAKNIYEHRSQEASYEFVIKPPWYRTILALLSYLLLFIALIYVIVTQYTKYLRGVIKLKTKEIRHQKEVVELKNEEIMDSIKYAKRIQTALLPPEEILEESKTEHFILFKPRDIVSGDFYWFRKIGDFIVIVAADCTGHGVPGAFVSMLGMAFLNEISVEIKEVKADDILNRLRALIIKSLRQKGQEGESKDGMDIALYVIDKKNMKIQFAGANNPLILIRNKELEQVKGDRMPIGFHLVMDDFKNNEIDIEKGDMLYTFSDGYQDQFGGEKGSKFMIKKLKQLMVEICEKPVEEQRQILDDTIENWKGTEEQVDDIILIGVRI
ncbi:SpoIIE family protein phosphatase [Bacteroidota bacterium]